MFGENAAYGTMLDGKSFFERIHHIKGFTKLEVSHRYFMALLYMKM